MIAVIIAGGSGTRLWPLSTQHYPKQLLKLTSDRSMVQTTFDRARKLTENIYVVPDVSHAELLKEQLPELDDDHFVVEPGRRGTANCIVAALAHVAKRHGADEPIAIMSTDHHIRDVEGFVHSFKTAAEVSVAKEKIVLVGIEPVYPATGFGYIERDGDVDGFNGVYKVSSFKEKPDFETAKKYVSAGNYLWNCGYFVATLKTFLNEMRENAPVLYDNYQKLSAVSDSSSKEYEAVYQAFENDTIDYALIEKTKYLLVVPAGFDWVDLGSFKDLHDSVEHDDRSNHFYGQGIHEIEVENSYVRNEEDKPIAVIGLDNVVIVNTKDGLLVARKDLSQKVGDIAKSLMSTG